MTGTPCLVGGSVAALACTEAVRVTVVKIVGGLILCLFTAPLGGASAQPTDKVFRMRLFGSQSGNRKQKMGNRTWAGLIAIVCALTVCGAVAQAQQPTKVTPIGYLSFPSLSANTARIEAFRQGLRELGYVEGKNIVIEWRSADGKPDRLPALAAELVRLKVAVVVTGGGAPTRRAKEATSTIPIVMTNDPDPVGDGFVASLARPGGNITGLSTFVPELSGKRLEILREVVPKLSRVAVLGSSNATGYAQTLKEIEPAAKAFKMQLQFLDVKHANDIETAFRAASEGRAQGVLTLTSGILGSQRAQIVELAAKKRLPVMYHQSEFVEAGGLMFYGVNVPDLSRRAATYVDKILKGAKPGDMPVEQPTKFEFIVNLKSAKQIGLTIPRKVLAQVDHVIEK
jgi:putative ABC transport system substrate-binding protein